MKEVELKPCPFCGGDPEQPSPNRYREKWVAIQCGCGARGPEVRSVYDIDGWEEDAAEAWNQRSVSP